MGTPLWAMGPWGPHRGLWGPHSGLWGHGDPTVGYGAVGTPQWAMGPWGPHSGLWGRGDGAVTSEEVEVFGVEQFEAKQRQDDLHREGAAVHKVPIEYLGGRVRKNSTPKWTPQKGHPEKVSPKGSAPKWTPEKGQP